MDNAFHSVVINWLYSWFYNLMPDVEIQDGENYFEKGIIDSLGVIQLIEDIENNFHIRFSSQDFQDRRFSTVSGLSEIICEKSEK